VKASEKVVEAGRQIAAHVLEAAAADIEFRRGRFVISGTDRSVGLMELAGRIHAGLQLPPDLPKSLDVADIYDGPPSAFPNGCHAAEVEVDPDTGMVEVVKYTFVNDFGVVINPLLVDGQAHGGIVQGIGQALRESTVYDEDGQLLTGSYMDYAMPRADDAPFFVNASHPVPAKTNPLGAKGCGEAHSSMRCRNTVSAISTCRPRRSAYGRRSAAPTLGHDNARAADHRMRKPLEQPRVGRTTDGSKSWDCRSSAAQRTCPEMARGPDDPPGRGDQRGNYPSLRAR